jgi:hypothetical protein
MYRYQSLRGGDFLFVLYGRLRKVRKEQDGEEQ